MHSPNICFSTEETVATVRQALDTALMVIKLKDDPETPRLRGLQEAYQAKILCEVMVNQLITQRGNPHDLDRFIELRNEASALVARYGREFKLTVAHLEQATQFAFRSGDTASTVAMNRTTVTSQPPASKIVSKASKRSERVMLGDDTVREIKKMLIDCGPTISFSDCTLVAMELRSKGINVSDANIYQIAIGNTWTKIPWPGGKPPIYKRSED